ncbi:transcriptional regulator, IclR family [Dethiosulfatibacter aminovorans DSM 17477]|uniref:Glycerol operon regulatory protein n=1 Tax=Dethiosulfatibacter aminovorans DSM 17477 TaxID=1121476 RepID=A0A1M6AJB0_9FIRM|nr:IclR family transcriptional regulator [Dethiosulfatibacter aminovorans]SHI36545.1 transcriptional regulator, IclR family [Dethiosulfatibacter aminovorans DSM 17477]
MSEKKPTTRSVDRALDILECFLGKERELSLMEISEMTELSPSTAHRMINSLMTRHFLERNNENKKFFLGRKIAKLGSMSLTSIDENLKELAKEYMIQLRDKENENVSLYVLDGDYKLCVERFLSSQTLRQVINIGDRLKIDKGSTGRVFLSHMEKEELDAMLKKYPNIDIEKVNQCREKGYTISNGERDEGLVGIAAPIYGADNSLKAVLSLSGPSFRFINENLNDKIEDTKATAYEISKAIGYQNNN